MDPAQTLAASAAQGFQLYRCEQCAENIRNALVAAGHQGQFIEIRVGGTRSFIICFSYDEGNTPITLNGRHVAVRVGDMVFDNLHPFGMEYQSWLNDFDADGGIVVHSVTDF